MQRVVVASLTALVMVLGWLPALAQVRAELHAETLQRLERSAGAPLRVARSTATGLVTFVSTAPGHPIPAGVPRTAKAADRALSFVAAAGPAFGIAGARDVVVTEATAPDEVGMEHVRLQQVAGDVPVRGGELIVHVRGNGAVAANGRMLPDADAVGTKPGVSPDRAGAVAADLLATQLNVTGATLSPPRLEVLNPGFVAGSVLPPRLAWFIEARAFAVREYIWVDAQSAEVLLHFSQLAEVRNRRVYTAGGTSTLPGTLIRTEGAAPTGDADADAAYDYSGDTYDYFAGHGRDSYDDAGASLVSTVHYCEGSCPYANAFWDGSQMVYGEGFSKADDVDAHELTHAVTEYAAGLVYCLQPGALNESFSDIFGETVDLGNTGGTDTPAVRWLMGEDVPGFGALRDMMDPTAFGDPGKASDPQFFCDTVCSPFNDNGGVHINSGVPNHAYALMVDGGAYNGYTVGGIGLTKAGKIQYRALTQYLTSGASFLDDYDALRQACTDLVGTAGITAADCTEVTMALDAVEMGEPICGAECGDGVVSPGEECDDGNLTDGDGCDSDCSWTRCGNGIVTAGEECDDGDSTSGDGCDINCTVTRCGNGVATTGEQCDDGDLIPADGCEPDCTLSPGCAIYVSTDVPRTIFDVSSATSTLTVPGGGAVADVAVVGLRGTHTYVSDLRFMLFNPTGQGVVILDRVCGSADNFALDLSDDAGNPILCPPTDGLAHVPSNPLSQLDGSAAGGTWTLLIEDLAFIDAGRLDGWGLRICGTAPAATQTASSTPTATPTDTPQSTPTPTVTWTPPSTPTGTMTMTRTATGTATATRTITPTVTTPPTRTPSRIPTVQLDPIPAPIVVGSRHTLTGVGFTAGSVVKVFVASNPIVALGPFTPIGRTPTSLTWNVPATMPLGDGFATVLVINTDQGYIRSNPQSQLLYGAAGANIPTIQAINGVPVHAVDPGVPLAYVETVVTQSAAVTIGGSGFNNPLVNLFTAAGNLGPLTPLTVTGSQIQVVVPANAPTGPGSVQVVNFPYTGNVLSNAVSVPIGSLVTIASVTQSGSTVTVNGTGFSSNSVINLFNLQGSNVVNFGGLNPSGGPNVVLNVLSSTQFAFAVPAGAVSGPAYVHVINPPYIAYSASGGDPDGAFNLVAP